MSRAAGRKNLPRAPQLPEEPANDAQGKQAGESARQDPAGSPIPGLTGNITNYETVRQTPATPDEDFDYNRGMMAHGVPNDSYTPTERALLERDGTLAQHTEYTPPELYTERPRPEPIPVYIAQPHAGGKPLGTLAAQKITIPASGSDPVRIAARDFDRTDMYIMVETAAGSTSSSVVTPGTVPATGVAQQNTNAFPVSVAIAANGATISAVTVNGVTVGSAAGTYTVPAYGAISVSYTVATPTWVWTGINNVTSTAPSGIRIDNQISNLSAGNGALLRAGMANYQNLDKFQDELFAVSNDGSACTISVMYLYQEEAAG